MTRKPTAQQVLTHNDTPAAGTRPYLSETSDFRAFVNAKRTEAVRDRDDMLQEVERLEVEIQARLQRIGEKDFIIASCDAALEVTIPPARSAPRLTPRTPEGEAQ